MNETGVSTSKANTPTTSNTEDGDLVRPGQDKVCPLCGGIGYVREDVPIDHPNFGRLFPCQCRAAEIERQRYEQLRNLSNLGHLAHLTFETFLPDGHALSPGRAESLRSAFEVASRFAEYPRGWLVLLGVYGCGKTHLAAAIANRLIERGHAVLFVVVPDLLDHLRATFAPNSPISYDERFREVRNAPILILDDLGTQSSTPWALEKLFQILNHRYSARLPTVITSNQSLEEIDIRIRSRMVDPDLSNVCVIRALDFRAGAVDREQSGLSSLGLLGDLTFDRFELREGELTSTERDNLRNALELSRAYALNPDGWLVLSGGYGCGKTHLAAAIANARATMGHPALFVVVPDLLDHLRATFSPNSQVRFDKRFEEVRTAPLLVLDDLGTESASPWAREKLFQLLNHRYVARLPTIITTVQKLEETDPRLRTRMLDTRRCTFFGLIVPSFRGPSKDRDGQKTRSRGGRGGR